MLPRNPDHLGASGAVHTEAGTTPLSSETNARYMSRTGGADDPLSCCTGASCSGQF